MRNISHEGSNHADLQIQHYSSYSQTTNVKFLLLTETNKY